MEDAYTPMERDQPKMTRMTLRITIGLCFLASTVSCGEDASPPRATAVSIGALLTLFGYKLVEIEAPTGERLLVALIETFETITGYVSNTLSFLRVAAFSLNHVALAIAVFTLVEMMNSAGGRLLMVVFGNIFILILEGAIVTIQALRLEYYEGFSRFYSGDGKEFKPLRLETGGHR